MTLKTCNTCIHLLGNRAYPKEFLSWKCGNQKNYKGTHTHVVSGEVIRIFLNESIYEVRITDCKGDWYEEYVQSLRVPIQTEPKIGGTIPTEIIFDPEQVKATREAAEERLRQLKEKKTSIFANIKTSEL